VLNKAQVVALGLAAHISVGTSVIRFFNYMVQHYAYYTVKLNASKGDELVAFPELVVASGAASEVATALAKTDQISWFSRQSGNLAGANLDIKAFTQSRLAHAALYFDLRLRATSNQTLASLYKHESETVFASAVQALLPTSVRTYSELSFAAATGSSLAKAADKVKKSLDLFIATVKEQVALLKNGNVMDAFWTGIASLKKFASSL
jgi:hypothetical protein